MAHRGIPGKSVSFSSSNHDDDSVHFEVKGETDPRFERVKSVFIANFADGREREANLVIFHHGVKVVDLSGAVQV